MVNFLTNMTEFGFWMFVSVFVAFPIQHSPIADLASLSWLLIFVLISDLWNDIDHNGIDLTLYAPLPTDAYKQLAGF